MSGPVHVGEIKFNRSRRNCFVAIPQSWNINSQLGGNRAVSLSVDCLISGVKATFSWSGEISGRENHVVVSAEFAGRLGFREGDEVLVCLNPRQNLRANQITLRPATKQDWQILELNLANVEYSLLNQIRVVWKDLVFPIWVQQNVCVFVKVANTRPMEGSLEIFDDTEVHVIPEIDCPPPLPPPAKPTTSVLGALMDMVSSVTGSGGGEVVQSSEKSENKEKIKHLKSKTICAKVVGAQTEMTERYLNLSSTCVAIFDNSLPAGLEFIAKVSRRETPSEIEIKLSKPKPAPPEPGSTDNAPLVTSTCLCTVKVHPNGLARRPSVVVPRALRARLGLEDRCSIIIAAIEDEEKSEDLKLITLHPITKTNTAAETQDALRKQFVKFLKQPQNENMLISSGTYVILDGTGYICNVGASFGRVSNPSKINIVKESVLSPVTIDTRPMMVPVANTGSLFTSNTASVDDYAIPDNHLEKLSFHIRQSLSLDSSVAKPLITPQCCLVTSSKGVGKSTFTKVVAESFTNSPNFVWLKTVACSLLRGKRSETLLNEWEKLGKELIFNAPSCIIFDDLDSICGVATGPEGEAGHDAMYFYKVSQAFIRFVQTLRGEQVCVIATSTSWNSLNPCLTTTQGLHLFSDTVTLPAPDRKLRKQIIEKILSKNKITCSPEAITDLVAKTEGYVARDVVTFVDRCKLLLTTGERDLTSEIVQPILKTLTPISLRGLDMHKKEEAQSGGWEAVGGLQAQKEILQETFLWPTLYPELMAQCPIRPVSGVLLYGAPGTGKTLLASAIAAEANVNFIAVKGPELLSKYIGASEQAVRDVFLRAQAARPCVIFFDEFDSMAPRRGHDSTGVTDRCVNQLLTLLDGVEADCQGLGVLAATSRPDLIDPALLRPGRLDRSIECHLPDKDERVRIMKTLGRDISFYEDVDFDVIAEKTQNFTGADLQALLFNAQLLAVESRNSETSLDVHSSSTSPAVESLSTLTYIPALTKGILQLSTDVFNSLPEAERFELEAALKSIRNTGVNEKAGGDIKHTNTKITISQTQLLEALKTTRPSLSSQEIRKFNAIYDNFRSGGSEALQQLLQGARATLA